MSSDLRWAPAVMRVGYVGRGLVHLAVAGYALNAIRVGRSAEGTEAVMEALQGSLWGAAMLVAICIGLVAYAVWRFVAAVWDLEARGGDAKGVAARIGMCITGAVHLGLAAVAGGALLARVSGGGGIAEWTGRVLSLLGGRWLVVAGGIGIAGAGLYYVGQGWRGSYRKHLRANAVTRRWNALLQAGVAAQGVVLVVVGGLFVQAGLRYEPQRAGGTGHAFDWIGGQAHGRILVGLLCLGLLAFALFCFVNARYRIVPRVDGDDVETLAAAMRRKIGV